MPSARSNAQLPPTLCSLAAAPAPQTFDFMDNGSGFGKIVIRH